MNSIPEIVTLTTDFGYADWFVGAMKGVILSICPGATVIDLSHGVPAGDTVSGAFIIREAYSFYPPGTVHVGVVDPGVGGERAAVAVRTRRYRFVGPDNGLLSLACEDDGIEEIVSIENHDFMLESVSNTFHGRDIFAPAAAHLAKGVPIDAFGRRLETISSLEIGGARRTGSVIEGNVIYIDHFGNLITNISADIIGSAEIEVVVGGTTVPGLFPSYAAVAGGEALALIGSTGYLEISVSDGNARERFSVDRGGLIEVVIKNEL